MKIIWLLALGYIALCNIVPEDNETMVTESPEVVVKETPASNGRYTLEIDYLGGDGHDIELTRNQSAVDPTYDQMIEFIKTDKTDRNEYIPDKYVCGDFAEDVQNNAEVAGYNCAWVYIEFEDGIAHACNAFDTTDRGLIFIDCTRSIGDGPTNQDCIVNVADSEEYTQKFIKSSNYEPLSMGVVESYEIIWDGDLW